MGQNLIEGKGHGGRRIGGEGEGGSRGEWYEWERSTGKHEESVHSIVE